MRGQPKNKDPQLKQWSRELRRPKNMAEAMLWRELRGRKLSHFKFRRQHVLGPYIVDFYCAAAQLVVELDGETHRTKQVYDRQRQAWLEGQGLSVIRCPNEDVYENLDGLMEVIWQVCRERAKTKSPSPPTPLPADGERGGS